jgi:hypothetical protein
MFAANIRCNFATPEAVRWRQRSRQEVKGGVLTVWKFNRHGASGGGKPFDVIFHLSALIHDHDDFLHAVLSGAK